jgi:hypothetical protein
MKNNDGFASTETPHIPNTNPRMAPHKHDKNNCEFDIIYPFCYPKVA